MQRSGQVVLKLRSLWCHFTTYLVMSWLKNASLESLGLEGP
jgi:hypothetical protein